MIDDLVKPLLKEDDPLLKQVSEPVTEFDDALSDLIEQMTETMITNNGRGISAIQIGVAKRIFIAVGNNTCYVMINPVITRTLNREKVEYEGCLSIDPKRWRLVSRPKKCDIDFYDKHGNKHSLACDNDLARVVQHEYDHLDGILITDKPIVYRLVKE